MLQRSEVCTFTCARAFRRSRNATSSPFLPLCASSSLCDGSPPASPAASTSRTLLANAARSCRSNAILMTLLVSTATRNMRDWASIHRNRRWGWGLSGTELVVVAQAAGIGLRKPGKVQFNCHAQRFVAYGLPFSALMGIIWSDGSFLGDDRDKGSCPQRTAVQISRGWGRDECTVLVWFDGASNMKRGDNQLAMMY